MPSALNAVIGNWEIGGIVTLHSGNAFTLNNFGGWGAGGNSDNTNGIGPETLANLPDCNGRPRVLNQRVNATGTTRRLHSVARSRNVSPAAIGTFGTCSVGDVRGPGYANVDLSLHKDFLITETKRLEFRFEALNAFNHPVWTFSGGPADGSFDPGSGPTVQSQLDLWPHHRVAGSETLQFALKFYF